MKKIICKIKSYFTKPSNDINISFEDFSKLIQNHIPENKLPIGIINKLLRLYGFTSNLLEPNTTYILKKNFKLVWENKLLHEGQILKTNNDGLFPIIHGNKTCVIMIPKDILIPVHNSSNRFVPIVKTWYKDILINGVRYCDSIDVNQVKDIRNISLLIYETGSKEKRISYKRKLFEIKQNKIFITIIFNDIKDISSQFTVVIF